MKQASLFFSWITHFPAHLLARLLMHLDYFGWFIEIRVDIFMAFR